MLVCLTRKPKNKNIILSVVLPGRETWLLSLTEDPTLRVLMIMCCGKYLCLWQTKCWRH